MSTVVESIAHHIRQVVLTCCWSSTLIICNMQTLPGKCRWK